MVGQHSKLLDAPGINEDSLMKFELPIDCRRILLIQGNLTRGYVSNDSHI